jgi:hypothetical protein
MLPLSGGELVLIERAARAARLRTVARPGEAVPEEWAAGHPVLVGWAGSDVVVESDRLLRQVERGVASGARRWAPGGRVLLV